MDTMNERVEKDVHRLLHYGLTLTHDGFQNVQKRYIFNMIASTEATFYVKNSTTGADTKSTQFRHL